MNALQNLPILRCTLICIAEGFIAGLVSAFFFTILIMLLSNTATAETNETKTIEEQHATDLVPVKKIGDSSQGQLLFKSNKQLLLAPLQKTDVHFKITGMVARVSVKQRFENTSSEWQEGIYVFPLPHDAAVDHMRMKIGERIIEGQIHEKKQAKRIYEQAKKQGKKASLVEQERANIFTNSVANIAPGESITIEIEYQQTALYDQGKFHLRFPMVVAPRYIPGSQKIKGFEGTGWAMNTDQVKDAKRITPPVFDTKEKTINPVSIIIDLNAGFELNQVYSPYHQIQVQQSSNNHYQIKLQEGVTPANRDFELIWQPQQSNAIKAALFSEVKNGDNYALLMMLPDTEKKAASLQREIIFVIDTSGSMAGESIRQAKSALKLALSRLKPGDRFNIIQFNSVFESLFQFPQPFSHQSIRQAKIYVDALIADGGTEMAPAMKAALKRYGNSYDVRQIVFLTDGSIGNENELFNIIKQNIDNSRLFPVGIGSAPNSHFMNRAARFGRGTFTFIGKVTEVQDRMAELFSKLESPVLTDIHLSWPEDFKPEFLPEVWPESIPDLYKGEPLMIAIKSAHLPKSLQISGKQAEQDWQAELQLQGGQQQMGISKLWARRKIAALMDKRLVSENQELIKKAITQLAIEHHLVSKFTSLVAVDITPARIKEELLKTYALGSNLPHGWKQEKVLASMPQTATPALLHLFIGALLGLIGIPFFRLTRRYV